MAKRNPIGDMVEASVTMTAMLVEAQTVIGLRMLGLWGLWNLGPLEHRRMWAEKADAAQKGGRAMAGALMSGATAGEAALAAVDPVRRHTRANVRRLTARGPVGKI
jgi:hypothetical protein